MEERTTVDSSMELLNLCGELQQSDDIRDVVMSSILRAGLFSEGIYHAKDMYNRSVNEGRFLNIAYLEGGCDCGILVIRDKHPIEERSLYWTDDSGQIEVFEVEAPE